MVSRRGGSAGRGQALFGHRPQAVGVCARVGGRTRIRASLQANPTHWPRPSCDWLERGWQASAVNGQGGQGLRNARLA